MKPKELLGVLFCTILGGAISGALFCSKAVASTCITIAVLLLFGWFVVRVMKD